MEVGDLQQFVLMLVLTGMILGVGIIVVDELGQAGWKSTNVVNESIAAWNNGTTKILAHGNITAFTALRYRINDTQIASTDYTVTYANGTMFKENNASFTDTNLTFASYTYKEYNTPTLTATSSVVSEMSGLASNWLGLIVTIVILAIIFAIVLKSFAGNQR